MQAPPWSLLYRFGFNEIPGRRIDDPAFAVVVGQLRAGAFDRHNGPKIALFVPGAFIIHKRRDFINLDGSKNSPMSEVSDFICAKGRELSRCAESLAFLMSTIG